MQGNYYYSIKNFSREENLAVAYFFYNVCKGVTSSDFGGFDNFEEIQTLYNNLVNKLNLADHSGKVIKAVIKEHIKRKNLTVRRNSDLNRHPYDMYGSVDVNFKEDNEISDRCGSWTTKTLEDINLVRAVFASKTIEVSKIIGWTFFCEPNERRKTFTIPEDFEVPEKIVSDCMNPTFVKLFIDSFKLSDEESLLLNIAYLSHTVAEFYPVVNAFVNGRNETRITIYSKCLGLPVRNIKLLLRRDRKLISFGIMTTDGDIESDAIDCIYSDDLNVFFSDVLKKDEKGETFDLDSFSVKEDESELALRLLKNDSSTNLLLYGAPGAGKTEYARALAKKSGLTPFIFKNELEVDDDSDNPGMHALKRLNCLLSLAKKDSVIIVDEAESLLSTKVGIFELMMGASSGSSKKGTVNTMLENSVNKVIWILNYTSPLDESTLRRFTYSIRFREMSRTMLKNIAETKLNKISMNANLQSELVQLCGKYHVTGASVDNMVKTVQGMDLSQGREKNVVNDVQKVLEANSTLLFGNNKMREHVKKSYDLSVLNTSTPAEKVVEMILNAHAFAEENGGDESGIRMLFYGISGTGKTELARYIAEKLNKKIILKRVSDIMSKYVGESEQNIAAAFSEAEASGDVLLFDEADSFFSNREDAAVSWERTLVNEFLTQMEEFSGILICTTNLRKIMDPAMQRRFHILTEFKPLAQNGIETLLKKFFTAYTFSDDLKEKLLRYGSVTPGDFGTLAGKIRFMPKSEISSALIIDELCKIQEEKEGCGRLIGFAG